MKKLFTLISMMGLLFGLRAQNVTMHAIDKELPANGVHYIAHMPKKTVNNQPTLRTSASTPMYLWYSTNDGAYAYVNGGKSYYETFQQINNNYPNSAVGTWQWGAVLFDTLVQVLDEQNNVVKPLPLRQGALSLDSIDIFFIHDDSILATDTIKITVFSMDSLKFVGSGPTESIAYNNLWDTLIITNTTIPLNFDYTGDGIADFTDMTVYPGLNFPQGKTFGVRVDYAADTASHFVLINSYADLCGGACVAANSIVGLNSIGYQNYEVSPSNNLSSVNYPNTLYYDCNHDNMYEANLCENSDLQNWFIVASVTVTDSFGAGIIYDSLVSCPNTQINLAANVFGSNAPPFTYSWTATGGGMLSSTTDSAIFFTADTFSSIVTVTVYDANNDSTKTAITIVSDALEVQFTSSNYTVPCIVPTGNNGTQIATRITGPGSKTYLWSTGAGTNQVFVKTPGTYAVTVSNGECSATGSVTVNYNGVSNSVSFTGPSSVVAGDSVTYSNTSTGITGWSAIWSMGNGDTITTLNATDAYAHTGTNVVILTMDSAGCTFSSTSLHVSVVTGINDVAFSNAISLQPNPTNGNVLLTINGAEQNVTLSVFNILGEQLKTFEANDVATTFSKVLDFNDFAAGTYLVKIQSGSKVAIKKLVVTR